MSREPASASTSEAGRGAMKALAVGLWFVVAAATSLATGAAIAQQVCMDGPPPGLSAPASRFLDNADGTVTDMESKLMWLHCSAGQSWAPESARCTGPADRLSWAAAQALASEVNRSGHFFFSDWRLPQLRELATITERTCHDPRVNLAVFPGTEPGDYWSASARPGTRDELFAYALSFGATGIAYRPKDEAHRVRLVRTAQ
jgi:Protein of unknown function (DUF1566)